MTVRAQNTSHAVMAQRIEPRTSLDDFPTPPWAVRAMMETAEDVFAVRDKSVWEPACGRGDMARTLAEYMTGRVLASDIHDYGMGYPVLDYLKVSDNFDMRSHWIITNPPFRLAEEFAHRALKSCGRGVALLVRTGFLEGTKRFERLFGVYSPRLILHYAERVPMVRGRLDRKASTATAYCWIIWDTWSCQTPETRWIPPSRKRLERPEDYVRPE
jgi:hypothetical protein